MSLRDKIDGNELDLSLNLLKEVPVKELAGATKATHLDISCNHIESLPNDFATLTHLIKIDLSKNRLTELPANIGNLVRLQHLDLYSNQIVDLPLSFARLKNLQWLDLKNNPLSPSLKAVAGNCLSEKECRECAKKVVSYMQTLDSNFEREKQKRLKADREKAAIEKAKLDKELEELRRLKKLEKEKRKAESRAKREALLAQQNEAHNEYEKELAGTMNDKEINSEDPSCSQGKGFSCIKLMVYITVMLFLFLSCGYLWAVHLELISVSDLKSTSLLYLSEIKSKAIEFKEILLHLASDTIKVTLFYIPIVKEFCLKIVHRYMMNITYLASEIEQMLAYYFNP